MNKEYDLNHSFSMFSFLFSYICYFRSPQRESDGKSSNRLMQTAYSAICQRFELHLLHVNRKLYLLSSLTFMVHYLESGQLCTFSVYLPVVTWYECLFLFRIPCDVSLYIINNIQGSAHPILIQEGEKTAMQQNRDLQPFTYFLFRHIVPEAAQPIMHRCKHRLKYNLSRINKQQLHIRAHIPVPPVPSAAVLACL